MGVLRTIGLVVAIVLALAMVAGGAVLLSFAATIGSALVALLVVGTIVVLAAKEFYDTVIRRKRR